MLHYDLVVRISGNTADVSLNFAPCAELSKIGSKSLNICCDKDTLFQCTSLPDANQIFQRERERDIDRERERERHRDR